MRSPIMVAVISTAKGWTKAEWRSELRAFKSVLRNAFEINGLAGEPNGWGEFSESEITGFRAPYLSPGSNLDAALVAEGYRYNACQRRVARPFSTATPGPDRGFCAAADRRRSGRASRDRDYNLFVRHSGGFEREDADGAFEQRSLAAFQQAFDIQYAGDRVPLQIGFHFTLMNGGAYWRALERFARDVCARADVDCISYADFVAREQPIDATRLSDVGG